MNLSLKCRWGFTLVELLVSLAVIAGLIALLVPTINTLRAKAGEAACAGNLRQIGAAFTLLLNDTDGVYPAYQDTNTVVWFNKLGPYLNLPPDVSYRESRPEVFKCPNNSTHRWDFSKLSYGYNQYLGDNDPSGPNRIRIRRVAITHPSEVILCADGDSREETYNSVLDRGWRGVGVIHRGGANILYTDGHVAWHLRDDEVTGDSWTEPLMRKFGVFGRYSHD